MQESQEIGFRLTKENYQASAFNSEDFDDVLACLSNKTGGGNPERFPEGCEESLALRDLSQKDEEHWQKNIS